MFFVKPLKALAFGIAFSIVSCSGLAVATSAQELPFNLTIEDFLTWVNPMSFRTNDGLYRRIFFNLNDCKFGRLPAPYVLGARCEGMYVEIAPNGTAKTCFSEQIDFGYRDKRNWFLSTEQQDKGYYAKCNQPR